jgi:hypothetical protein
MDTPTCTNDTVPFEDVELVSVRGLAWVCDVQGTRVGVPPRYVCDGTEVRRAGDRGRLVLPARVARDLGLF